MKMTAPSEYALKAYGYLPVTFMKRVVFGRDPFWKDFFWNRWGVLSEEALKRVNGGGAVWVEAQSLGELYQIRPLCRWLKERYPDRPLVLSASDVTAFRKAQEEEIYDGVFHSPWDLSLPTGRYFRFLKPSVLFFVEHVKTPFRLRMASQNGVPTALLSGFFPSGWEQNGFMRRPMALRFYEALEWVGVKGEEDAEGYRRLGVEPERVAVLGDLKFTAQDILLSKEQKERFRRELNLDPGETLWIAGNLHPQEIRFIASAHALMKRDLPGLRLLVAPRWVEHIARMETVLHSFSLSCARKSNMPQGGEKPDVILLDTYGELKYLYGIATVVFIGGSLETDDPSWKGLCHNVAEPLIHEKPIFFGKNILFRRVLMDQLLSFWEGFKVETPEALAGNVSYLLGHPELMEGLRRRSREWVGVQRQALQRHQEFIERILQ
ncbi:MAG: hypothetical protein HY590_03095 [Candidatus Omnitrophica bacterium]|nr:hypothetical protein [Candidatus Omnitrophota bacterium]